MVATIILHNMEHFNSMQHTTTHREEVLKKIIIQILYVHVLEKPWQRAHLYFLLCIFGFHLSIAYSDSWIPQRKRNM